MKLLIFMAWRNIWRYPTRSLLTMFALSGGVVIVILYGALLEGMSVQMVKQATEVTLGHLQIHRKRYIEEASLYDLIPLSVVKRLAARFPELTVTTRNYSAALASSESGSTGVLVRGVDPEQEPKVTRLLAKTRSGSADLAARQGAEGYPVWSVLVGYQLAESLDLQVGSELILVGQAWDGSIANGLFRVSGIFEPVDPVIDRNGVVMAQVAWRELMAAHEGVHEIAIRLDDPQQIEAWQSRLKNWLKEIGEESRVRNWREIVPQVANMLALSQAMLGIIGFIIAALASLGMLNTMLMAVHERHRELGTLKALGMNNGHLLFLVLAEAVLLALLAAALGCMLGLWIGQGFESQGIDFSAYLPDGYDWGGMTFEPIMRGKLEAWQFWNASGLMGVMALISASVPAWQIIRKPAVETMR